MPPCFHPRSIRTVPVLAAILLVCAAARSENRVSRTDVESRLARLEALSAEMEKREETARAEFKREMDLLRESREGIAGEVNQLRAALLGEASARNKTRESLKRRTGDDTLAVGGETASREGDANWVLRLVLMVVIVAAVFFMTRIFFARWGVVEETPAAPSPAAPASPRTPSVSVASAPPSGEPSAEGEDFPASAGASPSSGEPAAPDSGR